MIPHAGLQRAYRIFHLELNLIFFMLTSLNEKLFNVQVKMPNHSFLSRKWKNHATGYELYRLPSNHFSNGKIVKFFFMISLLLHRQRGWNMNKWIREWRATQKIYFVLKPLNIHESHEAAGSGDTPSNNFPFFNDFQGSLMRSALFGQNWEPSLACIFTQNDFEINGRWAK